MAISRTARAPVCKWRLPLSPEDHHRPSWELSPVAHTVFSEEAQSSRTGKDALDGLAP